jgi:hypothetical protein
MNLTDELIYRLLTTATLASFFAWMLHAVF